MDGARIGAGDRIVTRRNDTAAGVANRESWVVEAVTAEGSVVATPLGASGSTSTRRVHLGADYVGAHTQLGYATTDYGNQGVTTDASITWVTGATTAGGLYVGATRGRYDNVVHVVATDTDVAKAQLVAASGRDRVDRGPDVARSAAQADAVAVPVAPPPVAAYEPLVPEPDRKAATGAAPSSGVPGAAPGAAAGTWAPSPATWWTEAELDHRAETIEADLVTRLRRYEPMRVMSDETRAGDDAADRAAARSARDRATRHREEAERIAAGRDRLVETATTQLLAARDDAGVVAEGPGRFGRRAARVEAAAARRQDVARRWSLEAPGASSDDQAVRTLAESAVGRVLDPQIAYHGDQAVQAQGAAEGYDRHVASRAAAQQAAREADDRRSAERDWLIARAGELRAELAGRCQSRAAQVAARTPGQVTAADRARDAFLAEKMVLEQNHQARQRRLGQPDVDEVARRQIIAQQHGRSPDRGPGFGM